MPKADLILVFAFAVIQVITGDTNVDVIDSYLHVGKNATINCTYTLNEGQTFAVAMWKNVTSEGTEINELINSAEGPNQGRYSVDTATANLVILTISNASSSDVGYYQCVIFDKSYRSESDFASLTVYSFGKIYFDIVIGSIVEEGGFVSFVCTVNGNPDPKIILYKDEKELLNERTTYLTHNLTNVKRSEDGNYSCEAFSIAESAASHVEYLDVQFKPGFILVVLVETDGMHVVMAQNMSADPSNVTYEWTSDPLDLEDEDTLPEMLTVNVSDVQFTIFNVTVNVTNIIGSTVESVSIVVKDPCNPNPCKHGGKCSRDGAGGHNCDCRFPYRGMNCEKVWVIVLICCGGGCVVFAVVFYCWCVKKSNTGESSTTATVKGVAVKGGTSDGVEVVAGAASVTVTKENDLVRYETESGAVDTQVNLKGKNADNESKKPAPVNMNVEGLQYADLDLTRNLPTDKKNVIHHPHPETTYSSIQTQQI